MTNFDKVIPPGSEGKVFASVDISHIKGVVEKAVDVQTNDPARPSVKLSIKANIKTYFDIRPGEQLRFNVAKGDNQTKERVKEVIVVPTFEKPAKLMQPVLDSDAFDVKMTGPAAGTNDYKVTVQLKDTAKIGTTNATLKIPVEGGVIPAAEVRLIATVRGSIVANPPLISFQVKTFPDEATLTEAGTIYQQPDETAVAVMKAAPGDVVRLIAQNDQWYQIITGTTTKPGAEKQGPTVITRVGWIRKNLVKASKEAEAPEEQTVTIQKGTGNFKVLEYTSSNPDVKLSLEPLDVEANKFTLKASLANPGQAKKKTPPGVIIVRTNDPEQPEVKVPVYVIVS